MTTSPPQALHPFLRVDGPAAFAHRGGAAEAPENTMAAFAHAVDLGYRHLELDVRATADGEVVVFHDATLDRVTDATGRLRARTLAQLDGVRVAGTEPVPRLADVLSAWPEVRVNIDPKEDAVVAPLVELLGPGDLLDRVCVTSFSDRRLARLRRAVGPRLCTALGPAAMARLRLAASGVPTRRLRGGVAQVPPRLRGVELLDAAVVRTAHRLGIPVHVWVVDEAEEMERLLDLGVDGLMTDRPTVLRDVLRRRGLWPEAP
ncbi:glycerophosphodiester phosphodiesterase family protein [Iamia majanohamensis]|uniref:Glycerophosphodiester phosphodiesterase family protein n=1 Tax=Iamia majanohamensis TaxID=467976 RepID=A0AAE9Y763_9ACTN|nr:glycerophosphodiester phosphodiesterase family protein [Iamia majanohamensis]WCO66901.1 glycerophosphodiester phosphodiesterase family protein [Iamia majanohamensis]